MKSPASGSLKSPHWQFAEPEQEGFDNNAPNSWVAPIRIWRETTWSMMRW